MVARSTTYAEAPNGFRIASLAPMVNASTFLSLMIHAVLAALLFFLAAAKYSRKPAERPPRSPRDVLVFTPLTGSSTAPAGGGGGAGSPVPAQRGRLPKPAAERYVPPAAVIENPQPKLIAEASLVIEPSVQLPEVNLQRFGDPLSVSAFRSGGPGSGGGVGSGPGGGVGPGKGPHFGPGPGGPGAGGRGRFGSVTPPVVVFQVDPDYSEEARKAKYQGTVILSIEVDANGGVGNIRVVHGLGLGLDEKAIDAVRQWRFRPARRDGKPIPSSATIEVNFRLL